MRRTPILVIVVAMVVAGCFAGPGADHYAAVLDKLGIPADWELVRAAAREPGGEFECDTFINPDCPSVIRYYLAPGMAVEAFPTVKRILIDAGFTVDQEVIPACDARPSSPACFMTGSSAGDRVYVSLFNPGYDVEGLGLDQAGRSLILASAYRER